jgi:hypothetical protein
MRAHNAQSRWLTLMASLPARSAVERAGARRGRIMKHLTVRVVVDHEDERGLWARRWPVCTHATWRMTGRVTTPTTVCVSR